MKRKLILPALILVFNIGCDLEHRNPFDPDFDWSSQTPTGLTAELTEVSTVILNWNDNSDVEDGFIIERRINNGEWQEIGTVSENTVSFEDETIGEGNEYEYRVKASHSSGGSDWSSAAFIQTVDELILIKGGNFIMGNDYDEMTDNSAHSVTISDFYLSPYELTQGELSDRGYSGYDWSDSYGSGSEHPVYLLNWYDAVQVCNALSQERGLDACYTINGTYVTCDFSRNGYRLPTEAEWEYAAGGGAGNRTDYSGTNDEYSVEDYAWIYGNSGGVCHPVGARLPNGLGLYDMSGNVWEYCWDYYDAAYYETSPSGNPVGPSSGSYRTMRGGSRYNEAYRAEISYRAEIDPTGYYTNVGFRLARSF